MSQTLANFRIDENLKKEIEQERNIKYLEQVIADIESGKSKLKEHKLIEED